MESVYSFAGAVRGFHYYREVWQSIEKKELNYLCKDNFPYDRFAIKTLTNAREIVGYLLREISGVTKFFLVCRQSCKKN